MRIPFFITMKGVTTATITLVLFWVLAQSAAAQSSNFSPQVVREDVSQLDAIELQAFRDGVAKMKERSNGSFHLDPAARQNANFRRSWMYWANIHGHYGTGCFRPEVRTVRDNTTTPIQGHQGVLVWNQVPTAETDMWCSCAHAGDFTDQGQVQDKNQFLTWHRLYVASFERVLQQAALEKLDEYDDNLVTPEIRQVYERLAVPYWDYHNEPRLPEAFRSSTYVNAITGDTELNPLYASERQAAANNGEEIIVGRSLDDAVAAINQRSSYECNAATQSCNTSIDVGLGSTIHTTVHCRTSATGACGHGLMGLNETAAQDPIFWTHHSNIDRLYSCWTIKERDAGRTGLPTSPTVLNQRWVFVNQNGGKLDLRVGNFLTAGSLRYGYQNLRASCTELLAYDGSDELNNLAMAAALDTRSPAVLGINETESDSEAHLSAADKYSISLPEREEASGDSQRSIVLYLENVTDPEGKVIDVFLEKPTGERTSVQSIAFFAVGNHHENDHAEHSADDQAYTGQSAGLVQKSFEIPLTSLMEKYDYYGQDVRLVFLEQVRDEVTGELSYQPYDLQFEASTVKTFSNKVSFFSQVAALYNGLIYKLQYGNKHSQYEY